MLLQFVHMDDFANDWEELQLDDDDLRYLELAIMARPAGAPVVPGTGGLRKLRFAPRKWKRGKRGALRVCYGFFRESRHVVLVTAYSKSQVDDLSPKGKRRIRMLLDWYRREYASEAKNHTH